MPPKKKSAGKKHKKKHPQQRRQNGNERQPENEDGEYEEGYCFDDAQQQQKEREYLEIRKNLCPMIDYLRKLTPDETQRKNIMMAKMSEPYAELNGSAYVKTCAATALEAKKEQKKEKNGKNGNHVNNDEFVNDCVKIKGETQEELEAFFSRWFLECVCFIYLMQVRKVFETMNEEERNDLATKLLIKFTGPGADKINIYTYDVIMKPESNSPKARSPRVRQSGPLHNFPGFNHDGELATTKNDFSIFVTTTKRGATSRYILEDYKNYDLDEDSESEDEEFDCESDGENGKCKIVKTRQYRRLDIMPERDDYAFKYALIKSPSNNMGFRMQVLASLGSTGYRKEFSFAFCNRTGIFEQFRIAINQSYGITEKAYIFYYNYMGNMNHINSDLSLKQALLVHDCLVTAQSPRLPIVVIYQTPRHEKQVVDRIYDLVWGCDNNKNVPYYNHELEYDISLRFEFVPEVRNRPEVEQLLNSIPEDPLNGCKTVREAAERIRNLAK